MCFAVLAKIDDLALQNGAPAEEDLKNWGHHPDISTVPDEIMQKSAADDVTFIFSCQVCLSQICFIYTGTSLSLLNHFCLAS